MTRRILMKSSPLFALITRCQMRQSLQVCVLIALSIIVNALLPDVARAIGPPVYVGLNPNADFKVGRVMSRSLVIDPATGLPILVEFGSDGNEIRVVDLPTSTPSELSIIPANEYRVYRQQLEDFKQNYRETLAKGAELMSRREYEQGRFLKADNLTTIVPQPLPEGINSVFVRSQANRTQSGVSAYESLVLIAFGLDLTQDFSVSESHKSLIVNREGQILDASNETFGYRVGFYGNPNEPQDVSATGLVSQEDTVFGPVPFTRVFVDQFAYSGGAAITDDNGQYSFIFTMPPCPVGGFSYTTDVWAELRYRNFLPTGSPSIPYYLRSPGYSYCYAALVPPLLASSVQATLVGYATPVVQHNLYADIMFVTGLISLRNPNGEEVEIGETTYTAFEEDADRVLPTFYDFNGDGRSDFAQTGRIMLCTEVRDDDEVSDLPPEEIDAFLSDGVTTDAVDNTPGAYLDGFSCVDKHPELPFDPEEGGPWQGVFFDGAQDDSRDFPDLVRIPDHQMRNEAIGVLKSISQEDMRNTDILFFREATGQLILERRGLKQEEAEYRPAIEYNEDANKVAYRVMLRGPDDSVLNIGGGVDRRQSYEEWATEYQLTEPFQTRESDQPRPGEFIKIVAINRATGYTGTARVQLTSAATNGLTAGMLDVEVPPITLMPPNLKVWAERKFEVEAGLTAGEERQNTIGNEGGALNSDTTVTIFTEWLDESGRPLPDELGLDDGAQYGLTGRLAKVVGENQLRAAALADDLAEFPIAPGQNTQVLRIRSGGQSSATDHFYVHVIGKPKDQECVSDSSCPSFSLLSDAPDLEGRPALLTPFWTPLWNEQKSWIDYRNYRAIVSDYTIDTAEEYENKPVKPLPAYAWQIRPEYQFTQFEFTLDEVNREFIDDEEQPAVVDIIRSPDPVIASTDDLIEHFYSLISASADRLAPIDGEQQLILSLGGSEQLVTINANGSITFDNLDALDQLVPEDFLNIRLYTNNDEGNTLWEFQFEEASNAPFSRTISIATFNSTETSTASIEDITDSFLKLPFYLQEKSTVSIDVLDENLGSLGSLVTSSDFSSGAYGFIVTYEDLNEFIEPEETYYIAVNKEGVFSGEQSRKLFTGRLAERVDSEVLGQIIEHDTLIQRGSLTLRREDIKLSGVGPQLDFIRSYSNEQQLTNADSPMGPGWNHNHNIYLKILSQSDADGLYGNNLPLWIKDFRVGEQPVITPLDEFPDPVQIPQLVTVSNGGMFIFREGRWRPSRGFHGSLNFVGGRYQYVSKDGTQYNFQSEVSSEIDERFLVESIVDRNGNAMNYEYESYNQRKLVSKVTDASARTLEFTYDYSDNAKDYRLTQVESPETDIRLEFEYSTVVAASGDPDAGNQRPAVVALTGFERSNFSEAYTYLKVPEDKVPNLTSATDAVGNTTSYGYMSASQAPAGLLEFAKGTQPTDIVAHVGYPGGTGTAEFEYLFGNGNQRRVTDLNGNSTLYTLNEFGNPNIIEEPLGKRTEMVWTIDRGEDDVQMIEMTDALGRLFTYSHDEQGNVTQQTDAIGTVSQTWNVEFSLPLIRTDRNGNSTENSYDDNGNLAYSTDAEGNTTRHTYSSQGLRRTTLHPGNGGVTEYDYDQYGNVKSISFPAGSHYAYTNDSRGNKLREKDANGHSTVYDYDDLDRVTRVDHPDGFSNSYTYDDKGNKITETDKLGLTLTYSYDSRDRVENVTRSFGGGSQQFSYDNESNLLTETDWKGQETKHTYDALYRLRTTRNRMGDTMTMDYDLLNNLVASTDYRQLKTSYEYDTGNRRIREENPAGDEARTSYDKENNIITQTDFEGRVTTFDYDKRYLKVEQINALEGVAKWTYDARGNNDSYTDEAGRVTKYGFDRQNRMISERDARGFYTRVVYDGNGNKTSITDRRGSVIEHTYDEVNRVEETKDADGFLWKYEYDANGNKTLSVDGNGSETAYTYDNLNRLLSETTPVDGSITHTYDANNNLLTTNDAVGTIYLKEYDALDRLITEEEAHLSPIARSQVTTYDPNGNVLTVKNFRGFTTTYVYDDLNRIETVTDARDQLTSYTYDRVGNKLSVKDRRGNTTAYDYDALNRLIKTTDALEQTLESTYDPVGNALTITDKRGTVTTNTYDPLNRLLTSTKPDGNGVDVRIVKNEYDREGNIDAITDANGNRAKYAYNGRNLQITVTNPDNTEVTTTYDGVGNKLTITDEAGQTITNTYDLANRLETSTNDEGETTKFDYDLNNNKTKTTLPEGNYMEFEFDLLNRVTRIYDGERNVTNYTYDGNDNQLTHRDANGNLVTYVYDELDRRTEHRQPNNIVTTFNYDAEGNMERRTDPNGRVFTYGFDKINRQVSATFPPATSPYMQLQSVITDYDGNNNPVKTTENKINNRDGSSVADISEREFDLLDRQTKDTQRGHVIEYSYDPNGNRKQVSSAGGSTTYAYDSRNRLITATTGNGESRYTYTADSKQARVEYPNGTITRYEYDDADRMLEAINERQVSGNVTELISSFMYTYDDNSNRVTQTETQNGFATSKVQTTVYDYDNADRMTGYAITDQDSGDVQAFDYTFDANYNRKTEVERTIVNGTTTVVKDRTSSYDENNRLTTIVDNLDPDNKSIDYTYDNNGNTLTKTDNTQVAPEFTSFRYDSRNQLSQAIRGPPTAEESQGLYDYNAIGMRVRHLDSERGDIEYIYDGKSVLEERVLGNNALLAHYRYTDRLISLNTATDEQYYHYSALRTTANLTNTSGATQVSYRTDVWGHITAQQGSSPNRQVFTGQEHDQNTGLIYFGARYYDPDTARFINEDTYLGEGNTPPSLHRYLYAYGNPTVYIDLHGYLSEEDLANASRDAYDNGDIMGGISLSLFQGGFVIVDFISGGSLTSHDEALDEGFEGTDALFRAAEKQAVVIEQWGKDRVAEGLVEGSAKAVCGVVRVCKGAGRLIERGVDKVSDWRKKPDAHDTKVNQTVSNNRTDAQPDKHVTQESPPGPSNGTNQNTPNNSNSAQTCPCCFAGATLVATKSGLKPISEVAEGDLVASRNDETGEMQWKEVTVKFVFDDDRLTYSLTIKTESGEIESYEVTDNHPFNVIGEGWVDSIDLKPGMQIDSLDGQILTVVSLESLNQSPITYNIEVDGFHTYFVGELGAWVHNSCACGLEVTGPRGGRGSDTGEVNTSGQAIIKRDSGGYYSVDPNTGKQTRELSPFPDSGNHGHHSDPKFLGGDPKQKLTDLDPEDHRNLHNDMNDFLSDKTDDFGNDMRPRRGNSAEVIQENFTRDQCIDALCDFYDGPGAKYEDAAKDFFEQHPVE
ncbi:polymorphic toxin-type HINT domain-containing protein [Arenicella xantha]|uniref:RHS repeat-associated protein n=1 Tax=Arenicella xantha TaxID=644221 RepID=A0A395JL98_9GAMM|nr:polymorphic toxin-type HINT domain-containing protein [Arenicella xantha]RBP48517.1 RHS repeat-associated protein [Arenicella xantha]